MSASYLDTFDEVQNQRMLEVMYETMRGGKVAGINMSCQSNELNENLGANAEGTNNSLNTWATCIENAVALVFII